MGRPNQSQLLDQIETLTGKRPNEQTPGKALEKQLRKLRSGQPEPKRFDRMPDLIELQRAERRPDNRSHQVSMRGLDEVLEAIRP